VEFTPLVRNVSVEQTILNPSGCEVNFTSRSRAICGPPSPLPRRSPAGFLRIENPADNRIAGRLGGGRSVKEGLGMQRMDFETLVQTRKSVRGFRKEPVARAVIEDIIEVAKRAPSSMNTQPWHIHVLTGDPLEEVRRRNMEEMLAGAKAKRDIVSHGEYQGVHRGRQVDIAKKLFAVMGIAREDKPMRQDWVLRGFRQFDAPVSLVLTYDKILDPGAVCHFDLGALCYGLVLAAWDRGLGSVINGQGIMRSDIVREVANIPEDEVIMTCVAMGHPDDSFPANAVRSDREANGDFVRYVGFSD
jgi:nitroreductase